MIIFLILLSLFSSIFIGMGLGARGQWRNRFINIGFVVTLLLLIFLFLSSISLGIITIVLDVFCLYGTAFIFNKKYKGLDIINYNLDSKNYTKNLIKEIRNKK